MDATSFDDLLKEVLADRDARTAMLENALRRRVSSAFEKARNDKGLTVRGLAKEIGTSVSQVQRLLHQEAGGSLSLRTICRAADALGLSVQIHVRPKCEGMGKLIPFSKPWHSSYESVTVTNAPAPRRGAMQQFGAGAVCNGGSA